MKIGVDTSVLAYAEGVNDARRKLAARALLGRLTRHELAMPLQVASEFFQVLVRKRRLAATEARAVVVEWQRRFSDRPVTTDATFEAALDLAADHGLQIFDALIVSACAGASCRLLLSEDMHNGFVWRGVTVANPFAGEPHPLLADALLG